VPTESIDVSDLWYGVEEGCYTEKPAPGLRSYEQYSVPSTPVQARPPTLPQATKPLQDQTSQQGIGSITRSKLAAMMDGPAESMAELEKELGLAL